jgi:2-oxoglutarate/2-oxoacid ferredoxin oxidoreductase subunit beta
MSTTTTAPRKTNRIGLDILSYRGGKTTLCAGCGHNSITERLTDAFWDMGIQPWDVAKVSGIGCSSKTPAYFLGLSHGFNGVHGRAPAIATGAMVANHTLRGVVVTGDGDTVSIGLGQFMHMLRRNIPLIYIIENNGVYGLTKGQFSATADVGSKLKTGLTNEMPPVDVCLAGVEMGATFIARSFSGDKRQLSSILKAAIAHKGLSVIDVVSPCVTFNDHVGSTKSYSYMKDHEEALHDIDFVPGHDEITVDYDEGTTREVEMYDGSRLFLKKLDRDYDPTDRHAAIELLTRPQEPGEVLTGVIYVNAKAPTLIDRLELGDEPLATLPVEKVRPPKSALDAIVEELR